MFQNKLKIFLKNTSKVEDILSGEISKNYIPSNSLIEQLDLLSITVEPEFEVPDEPYSTRGELYYNVSEKKIYTSEVIMNTRVWTMPSNPSLTDIYNFGGLSYKWNGVDMILINLNPGIIEMYNNFEDADY